MEDFIDRSGSEGNLSIQLENVSMAWIRSNTEDSPTESDALAQSELRSTHTLSGLDLSVPTGSLVAVVGPVGSGKSSLLNGLLGELILKEGSVRVHGSVAYCDQRAWILNATIKDNILFGLPYEKERFERA